jgi:hypothetical protein
MWAPLPTGAAPAFLVSQRTPNRIPSGDPLVSRADIESRVPVAACVRGAGDPTEPTRFQGRIAGKCPA